MHKRVSGSFLLMSHGPRQVTWPSPDSVCEGPTQAENAEGQFHWGHCYNNLPQHVEKEGGCNPYFIHSFIHSFSTNFTER